MNNKNICAGIVTFNPNLSELKNNISAISKQVEHIYIFDNGSKNFDDIKKNITNENAFIIHKQNNKGIAYALNQICKKAISDSFEWIITLDQDSLTSDNLVNCLARDIRNDIGIVSPNIIYKNNESFCDNEEGTKEIEWVITSASLMNLNSWKKVGGFDESLFIDGVDYDYCIRIRRSGYKIIRDYDVALLHELGNLHCIKILGRTVYVTNHSPVRHYYICRNNIYLWNKFHLNNPIKGITKEIIKIILFENSKIEKMRCVFFGISDGIKNNMGKWHQDD